MQPPHEHPEHLLEVSLISPLRHTSALLKRPRQVRVRHSKLSILDMSPIIFDGARAFHFQSIQKLMACQIHSSLWPTLYPEIKNVTIQSTAGRSFGHLAMMGIPMAVQCHMCPIHLFSQGCRDHWDELRPPSATSTRMFHSHKACIQDRTAWLQDVNTKQHDYPFSA